MKKFMYSVIVIIEFEDRLRKNVTRELRCAASSEDEAEGLLKSVAEGLAGDLGGEINYITSVELVL